MRNDVSKILVAISDEFPAKINDDEQVFINNVLQVITTLPESLKMMSPNTPVFVFETNPNEFTIYKAIDVFDTFCPDIRSDNKISTSLEVIDFIIEALDLTVVDIIYINNSNKTLPVSESDKLISDSDKSISDKAEIVDLIAQLESIEKRLSKLYNKEQIIINKDADDPVDEDDIDDDYDDEDTNNIYDAFFEFDSHTSTNNKERMILGIGDGWLVVKKTKNGVRFRIESPTFKKILNIELDEDKFII